MKSACMSAKRIAPPLFITLFILLFLVQNYIFILKDNSPPHSDVPRHISKISEYLLNDYSIFDQILRRDAYPPLAHLVGLVFFMFLKPSADVASFSLFIFIIIFLLALYGIGYEYGGHFSGAAVMALGASSPHIINYSRVFYVDFPETAMTALSFYVLLKTEGFGSRFYSVLLGFVLSLALFTKWAMAFYMFLPLIWFILPQIIRSIRSFLVSGLFGILILCFIMRLRYLINLNQAFLSEEVVKITLINFLLPGIFFASAVFMWIKIKGKSWDDRSQESLNRVFNAVISCLIAVFSYVPWLLWSSVVIFDKIRLDKSNFGNFWMRFTDLLKIMLTSFNYIPLFILTGIVLIFVYREKDSFKPNISSLFFRILLPFNLIFCLLLMSYISPCDIRYMLSLVIFFAALGGWWVGWTGKGRIAITGLIVTLSMTSVMGWLFIPQGGNIFKVIYPMSYKSGLPSPEFSARLLAPAYPSPIKYDVEPVIKILKEESDSDWKTILWIYEGNEPVVSDYMRFLTTTEQLRYDYVNIWDNGSNIHMLNRGKIVFISCHSEEFAEKEIKRLRNLWSNAKIDIDKFEFSDGFRLYLLRIR